jgi:hypothetical protein
VTSILLFQQKNLSYYQFHIFVLSRNSSHAKRTLTFQEDGEEIKEHSVTPYANNEKRKK